MQILTQMCFQDGVCTFKDFLRKGLVEYLDVNEENNASVCFDLITYSFFCLWNLIPDNQSAAYFFFL